MSRALRQIRFYYALYATRLGLRRRPFREIHAQVPEPTDTPPKKLNIFFWTPGRTAGANVIVHDMLPALQSELRAAALDWRIAAGANLPQEAVDWLICFKAVPEAGRIVGRPRLVLLICDQVELFWHQLARFDALVATASRPLAALLANGHPQVALIPESEPLDYLEFGRNNLATAPTARGHVLLWHGGPYSLGPLDDLRGVLEEFSERRPVELHVISGRGQPRDEHWRKLAVKFFPWSKEQLFHSAAQARLGLVPARPSLRASWLKPASRVRCLCALGVPTIGDERVPDVVEFLSEFAGPRAGDFGSWPRLLDELWDAPDRLAQLAAAGHAAVAERHSTRQTARRWIHYLSQTTNPVRT